METATNAAQTDAAATTPGAKDRIKRAVHAQLLDVWADMSKLTEEGVMETMDQEGSSEKLANSLMSRMLAWFRKCWNDDIGGVVPPGLDLKPRTFLPPSLLCALTRAGLATL